MSRKRKPQPAAEPAVAATTERSPATQRAWWMAGGIGLGTALVWGGFAGWNWYEFPRRIAAQLPAVPGDLAGESGHSPALGATGSNDRPASGVKPLAVLLAEARARVGTRGETLAAVAKLGRLYHANGFRNEAAVCWEILRGEQPREARWCHYLADLRRGAGDTEAAERLLDRTVELAPECAPAWLQLAAIRFKSGRTVEAAQAYAWRLKLLPGDPHAQLGLARVALQNGERDEARRRLEALVRETPKFSPAQNLYAELLAADGDEDGARWHRWLGREAGRFREAEDTWLAEIDERCVDPARLRVLGTIDFQTNFGDRGRARFDRAIALAPRDPAGHAILGELFLQSGKPTEARASLERAVFLSVESGVRPAPMLFVNLSEACRQLGDLPAAFDAVARGLAQAGDAWELHNARGVLFASAERHAEAVAAFRAALMRSPHEAETCCNLGESLLALDRADEAHAAFLQGLVLQPTFPRALRRLGEMELSAGDLGAAEKFLRPLYETNPGVPAARQLFAEWYRQRGTAAEARRDAAGAEREYRAGLALDPESAGLNAGLGVLCLVQGRVAEAVAPLEKLRSVQPAEAQAALFLGQAYARLGRREEARTVLREGVRLAEQAGNAKTAGYCREILKQLE